MSSIERMFGILIQQQVDILREKCPYSDLFWFAFFRVRAEYGERRIISLHSVRMW